MTLVGSGDKTVETLKQINATLTALNPLVGAAVGLGAMLVKSIRERGTDIGPFQSEIDKFDQLVAQGIAVDAQWRADHGLPPVGG